MSREERVSQSSKSDRAVSTKSAFLVLALALVLALVAGPGAAAQVPDTLVETLRLAVDQGDVDRLVALGEARIEVGLFGAARLYSRSQARRVLLRFFRDNPPTRLNIRESVATDKAWFATGDYRRLGGREPLRVYIRLRKAGDDWQLREFVVLEASGL